MSANWEYALIGDAFETVTGNTPPKSKNEFYGDFIPFIKPPELTNGIINNSADSLSLLGAEQARVLPPESVFVSCIGNLGKLGMNQIPATCNQQINAIKPNYEAAYPKFVFYYCHSNLFRDRLHQLASGTTIPIVNKGKFNSIRVPLPSLHEQERIVAILDEAFAAIATATANAKKNLANARELFVSYLNEVFTLNVDDWSSATLDKLCKITHGFAFKGKDFTTDNDLKKPIIITPGNFTEEASLNFTAKNTKRFSGVSPKGFAFDVGDLVVVMTDLSSKMKILGKPAFIERSDVLHNQRIGRLFFKCNLLAQRFLYFFFQTNRFLDEIKKTATGTMVKHTAPKRILSNVISFPELVQQKVIVEQLDILVARTRSLEDQFRRKIEVLGELKQSILKKAFSGELTASIVAPAPIPFPVTIEGISPTDLHAGILAIAYRAHEAKNCLGDFGRVKGEKIAHMVEAHVGVYLGRNPVKDAAGPNDYHHLKQVEHRANMAGFFSVQRRGNRYVLIPKHRFDWLIEKTYKTLGNRLDAVKNLITLMLPMTTRQSEIFATIYAAWNNLLLDGIEPSDDEIVYEAREGWHPEKLNIPRAKFVLAIKWMREKKLMPKGVGKKVSKGVSKKVRKRRTTK